MFFFESLQLQNVPILSFPVKYLYLLTSIITRDGNNPLKFLHAVQDLRDSLHVGRNF